MLLSRDDSVNQLANKTHVVRLTNFTWPFEAKIKLHEGVLIDSELIKKQCITDTGLALYLYSKSHHTITHCSR
ncbi:hypothetical protein T4D_4643 [Trichinella pseudospiralis]|uniref:Uncharacterized protein n=1 Tax=Trichinella pseudospiralis TaxID=6337 RepID=A0A0V1FM02_TRIPS|nr:hypothetical protein T4D_4643 [Trichinella pseudospiralis]